MNQTESMSQISNANVDRENYFGMFRSMLDAGLSNLQVTDPFVGTIGGFYGAAAAKMRADNDWYVSKAPKSPSRVLDLCCGGGRSVVDFARQGHQVLGVDISSSMLRSAQRLIDDEPLDIQNRIDLQLRDIFTIESSQKFDVVVLGGLTITLFRSREDRERLFKLVRENLCPGGTFVFDYSPLMPGDQIKTNTFLYPIKNQGRNGFVIVGGLRNPQTLSQYTNLYAEIENDQGAPNRYLATVPFSIIQESQLDQELKEYGFTIDETFDIGGNGVEDSEVSIPPHRLLACSLHL